MHSPAGGERKSKSEEPVARTAAKSSSRKPLRECSGPVRWEDIPHDQLWTQALASLLPGSADRAESDAIRSVLKRRLLRRDPADHTRYIELECARIVETLRRVRDVYRSYLKPKVRGALSDLYWVILRFGVKDWAVMLIRAAAVTYPQGWTFFFGPSQDEKDVAADLCDLPICHSWWPNQFQRAHYRTSTPNAFNWLIDC